MFRAESGPLRWSVWEQVTSDGKVDANYSQRTQKADAGGQGSVRSVQTVWGGRSRGQDSMLHGDEASERRSVESWERVPSWQMPAQAPCTETAFVSRVYGLQRASPGTRRHQLLLESGSLADTAQVATIPVTPTRTHEIIFKYLKS